MSKHQKGKDMQLAVKNGAVTLATIEEQIDTLIEQAWEAFFRASATTKLYRKQMSEGQAQRSTTQLVNAKMVLMPSFDREGNYLMARVAADEDIRLYDQIEIGGFRFEVLNIGERTRIGPRQFVEVVAKRLVKQQKGERRVSDNFSRGK